jgi:hypothetical protein
MGYHNHEPLDERKFQIDSIPRILKLKFCDFEVQESRAEATGKPLSSTTFFYLQDQILSLEAPRLLSPSLRGFHCCE